MKNLNIDNLAIIPGPAVIPQPCSSVNIQSIAEYSAIKVTNALLQIESVQLQSADITSMWDWKAKLETSTANLSFGMTCMGDSDEFWGGFQLHGTGRKEHITTIWDALKAKGFTAVWLHDSDCNMYTREGFLKEFRDYS